MFNYIKYPYAQKYDPSYFTQKIDKRRYALTNNPHRYPILIQGSWNNNLGMETPALRHYKIGEIRRDRRISQAVS